MERMNSIITARQQDTIKGWLHSVRKKTTRLSTRITAKLGLISLTQDDEFARHYETFKHIEKTIRNFIKNLNAFVEHFEAFLTSLQQTSDGLANFYRDRTLQRDLEDLKRNNKILANQYFNAFKKTIDEHVITVANQLLHRFIIPHQLIHKRKAKLLDYDNKTRELNACRDETKKSSLKDQYVIAKDIYEKINKQLIEQLPIFNQIILHVFKECIQDLLENRKNLIESYANQVSSLLNTPLLMNYATSGVSDSLLNDNGLREIGFDLENDRNQSRLSAHANGPNQNGCLAGRSSIHDETSSSIREQQPNLGRSQVPNGQLGFDIIARGATHSREISCSTPLPLDEQNASAIQSNHDNQHPPNELPSMLENTNYNIETRRSDILRNGLNNGVNVQIDEVDTVEPDHRQLNGTSNNLNQTLGEKNSSTNQKRRKHKFPTYIALWAFEATDKNQLTIVPKQELKIIKACDENGNAEWSLVRDKWSRVGYVPSAYIKKKNI